MPSFDFMDKVELFVRAGTFPVDASKSSKKVTRAASKHFLYKDGCLWRSYRGRLLRVVRNDEEMREILTRYHDNNNHAGRVRAVKEIMLMYYWVGVTEAVKTWIKACAVCQSRGPVEPHEPPVQFCLAYGCDASSYVNPELSFHRFPKAAERRRRWLAVAQRDEGSLRTNSCLCSRHFEPPCFTLSEEGQLTLSPDAIPTIIPVTAQEEEVPVPSDEDFLHSNTLEDLLSTAAAAETTEPSGAAFDHSETPVELQEHQYCLPAPDPDSKVVQAVRECKRRKTVIEPSFAAYNQIARYLSHRILPMQSKKSRGALKRMAKRFGLIDGVLMYTRVSPPLRVPRSREEVNSILEKYHDKQGHFGQGICQREISKQYYWASMTRDLARWITSCVTCLSRTKRKWLRCSVSNCTNCCGPVERGLGLTFHKFPLHNVALLAHWLKAVGRPNWHPRLWSSVCSTHFTEDCFDRGGEKVTLRPDAVPTLLVHSDSATPSRGPAQSPIGEEAYFAKYDAVELYLSKRTYPPGLSYVEKNTFRRFCKQFSIKDDELHVVRGDRVRSVLRSRQQVEAALVDFHNELNHLDVTKCLRLLNERYFWKTMKTDVVQWINSCSLCSSRRRKRPETEAGGSEEALRSPQIHEDSDSGKDGDGRSDDEEDDGGDVDEGGESVGDEEKQPATNREVRVENPLSLQPVTPSSPQPRIPILLHLRTPINFQPRTPIILQPRTPNTPFVTRLWSVKRATPPQSEVQNSSDVQPENRSSVQVPVKPETGEQTQPQDQNKTSGSRGSARTHHYVVSKPLTEPHTPPEPPAQPKPPQTASKQKTPSQTPTQTRSRGSAQHPEKRKRDLEAGSSGKRSASGGLEPVVAPSTKPWPVFTISGSAPAQTARPPPEVDSSLASLRRPRRLQARTVIQQCSRAKVKTRPAVDGTDTLWAEIQDGIVVYVCFFHGATEDVTYEIASSLMTTKLFRKDTGHSVSVLDLPGSVLLIPQDSLLGQPVPRRRIQYKGGCELWWGAQLFSNLVSACRDLMSGSVKCTKAGVKVEQGVYGQKQEIALNSLEPLTLLLEF
ncbi:uncharacterized protein LOC127359749 isoform X1 [Dicentrarchus labrax]|uniref:uncharacterized protein LOC127359749 isoform X1 n=1 Tax=Dicentrarchus labrax TaxID=13489 RepID=UPI0021F560B9|nr:uncharacterized protein LOC127359749 isoform X1 [Dicentrarchus labrax]XP_051249830.1 uncharacterized protein LOC127359749 isoform X1 [Dicentrarchus labrax]XP_051249835.1 uncharacterized protein LOC127359749 isoform X1 [Dicentrarchus labrax]XP_051249842.1 uncharacterized protein LOC127359749 isoform X1 [Dicentrarchus labrax]